MSCILLRVCISDSVKSLDICDKICSNVNLSKSVVTLKSEAKDGTTEVLLKDGTKTLLVETSAIWIFNF